MVTYIGFSCRQKGIVETLNKCSNELGYASLVFDDFYRGFLKESGPCTYVRNTDLEMNNGTIRYNKCSAAIYCIENDVSYYQGFSSNTLCKSAIDPQVIYYDLENITESVLNFTEKTGIPEFFFWKTILVNNQGKCSKEYEQFGELTISRDYSVLWNDGDKIVLKNKYYHDQVQDQEEMVVVENKKDEKFDKFLDSITKLVETFKSQ